VKSTPGTPLRLEVFRPVRPSFRPRSAAKFEIRLETSRPLRLRAELELLDLDRVVGSGTWWWQAAAGTNLRTLAIELPPARQRGYSVRLTVRSPVGEPMGAAETVVEGIDGWWESPRHACLIDFSPGHDPRPAVSRLVDWQVNVVQFYDWMYRHYRYRPPGGRDFTDVLGRRISHRVVRAAIQACHAHGIAALAYGSVYGAEREYVDRHPDEVVLRRGRPVSLGDTFFVTDLRRGSGWRRRLLAEYETACRELGFDGIHMDQYGQAYRGRAADGSRLDFPRLFREVIDEADARLRSTDPSRRLLFNAVGGWPLESSADSASAAIYIEIWPPDVRYSDLIGRIAQARMLAPGKAVVIAAYLSILARVAGDADRRAGALEAALLLTSVVLSGGAYLHALAEGDRVLVDGYYPLAQPLEPGESEALRAAWRFSARYRQVLHDPDLRTVPTGAVHIVAGNGVSVPVAEQPGAGSVWIRLMERPGGGRVLHLIDLRGQAGDEWDGLKEASRVIDDWVLRLPESVDRVLFASPWSGDGLLQAVAPTRHREGIPEFALPAFQRWAVVLLP